jgi:hypothetical protein
MNPRLETIGILQKHNIPICIWGEDALRFYGVPTVVFELYVLVLDSSLIEASTILSKSPFYRHVPFDEKSMEIHPFRQVFLKYWSHRFLGSWSDITGVQLLPAQEFCHFVISPETTIEGMYPKLSAFIEALAEKYLELVEGRGEVAYRTHTLMYLFYLGEYALKERDSILDDLSPRAHRLWKDILEDKVVLGEEGLDMYRDIQDTKRESTEIQ